MNINLHLLRIFFTVVEQGNFSRAAEALYISQPAVSKAVSELERQLGLPLMERGMGRGRKGVCLTESGRALFEHARGIFALERAALEDVKARVGMRKGQLTIGASSTIAGYWLQPCLSALLTRFPGIDLKLVTGNTQLICQSLVDCHIDLALVEGSLSDDRIQTRHWCDDELWLIAAPHSPLVNGDCPAPACLSEQTWFLRERGSGTRQVTEAWWRQAGITPGSQIEFGNSEGIVRAVAAGLGVALLSAKVARDLARLGEVVALPIAPLHRPLLLCLLHERPLSPLAQACCDILAEPIHP
ncbi:LysR family transcriptional regulator [Aeromonas molluscorum]|jgi:LysR family transcriptional regulator, transcriptional activator of the cysJI operon|uniref:LysR family transcriptional regulator n=1 Tax=Aeromonas molluscorum 848 TaxID=1268236 RepID=R1H968_9GAMM|nr:LysR substrate-binding domain-containing protein [Aeromonas molluscorum]EOD54964.1 LysR family transcriptional regulator [Aeromonas molluscorum 848]